MSTAFPQLIHPDASHINPDYRDGHNDCLKQVLAALAESASVQPVERVHHDFSAEHVS